MTLEILYQLKLQHIIYLALLIGCCSISFLAHLSDNDLKIFRLVFTTALVIEIIVALVYSPRIKFPIYLFYHVYIPLEYALITWYLTRKMNESLLRQMAISSIPIFPLVSFLLSQFHIGWTQFPGFNLNMEGTLLCTWSIIVLLSVNPHRFLPIYKLPIFWICLAIIIYHSGTFVMNGLFNFLNLHKPGVFKSLREIINKNLNILLYIMFIIAFVCSHQMKKFSSQ